MNETKTETGNLALIFPLFSDTGGCGVTRREARPRGNRMVFHAAFAENSDDEAQ
jgi:hypothetical protein